MQTHEWEALLDGTTPGPWEVVKCHATWKQARPEENALIPERRREFTVTLATPVDGADIVATSDTHLIAAVPEAVAEVIRLRREIAAMRDQILARTTVAPAAPVFNDLADTLTRILEGDTDE